MKFLSLMSLMLLVIETYAQSYFQQRVDTRIDVSLDDKRHVLHGYESFVYTNNSKDTLTFIYLHLWPNAYMDDRTPFSEAQILHGYSDFYFSKQSQKGHIDSLNARVDGISVELYTAAETPDIAKVALPKPLLPGGAFTFTTTFRVKIPNIFSRLGHKGQSYFISQWFPKPAVYDNNGWHPMSYLNQGEFYSEFGSYDVSITLPKNYVLLATGNCTDNDENAWLDSLSKQPAILPKPIKVGTSKQLVYPTPPSDEALKTVHFHEDNVHDFAWFANKRFVVRKKAFLIPGRQDSITAIAAFLPEKGKLWESATQFTQDAVIAYSKEIGNYPYNTVKVVSGSVAAAGGMEYPTIALIDNSASNYLLLKRVILHEVGHNWFYGMLGSNERKLPLLDEGVNSFYEQKFMKMKPSETDQDVYYYLLSDGRDQSTLLPAQDYTFLAYGGDIYAKAPLLLQWLEQYMGKTAFKQGMQQYFTHWQFKHPSLADFRDAMQGATSQNIDWFFNDALATDKPIDFDIKKVRKSDDSTYVWIRNKSGFAAPVGIEAMVKDSVVSEVWSEPFSGTQKIALPSLVADKWLVSNKVPDANAVNSIYKKSGLFHGRGLKFSFGYTIGNKEKQRVHILPALGYNVYNGFMGGVVLHNISLPDKRFRYILAPMYGFGNRRFAGAASIGYFTFPKNLFQEIAFQVDAKTFAFNKTDYNVSQTQYTNYYKIAPSVTFTFKEPSLLSPVVRKIGLKGYYIGEEAFLFAKTPPDTIYRPSIVNSESFYGKLSYSHENNRLLNPFSYNAYAEVGRKYVKLALNAKVRIDYNTKDKALYVEGFFGKFFNNGGYETERQWLNTTVTGNYDYLYDGTYFGRNEREGVAYQQIGGNDGNGKIPTEYYVTPLGRSDNWLAALNIKTDLPFGKLPVRLYLDINGFADARYLNPSGEKLLYTGGLQLHFLNDILQINMPLVFSKDYNEYLTSIYPKERFLKTITFNLQLNKINWLKATNTFINTAIARKK